MRFHSSLGQDVAVGKQPQKAWSEQNGKSPHHRAPTSDSERNDGARLSRRGVSRIEVDE